VKRIDKSKTQKWNIVIIGESGTGKTRMGTLTSEPLIALSERQGLEHIREAARGNSVPVPPVLFMETVKDYQLLLRAFHGNQNEPFVVHDDKGEIVYESKLWPKTLVIDSLSDAMNKIKIELLKQAPPVIQRDKLSGMSQRHWSTLRDRGERFIWSFRDLPLNVIFLCLRKVKDGDENIERFIGPDLPMNALSSALKATANIVVHTYRRRIPKIDEHGNNIQDNNGRPISIYEYGVLTRGPDYMGMKPAECLDTYEVPDVKVWINKLEKQSIGE
jgi:hypothetical protein